MRLFLSSYQLGNQPRRLLDLIGDNKHVAIVTNAGDYHAEAEIAERFSVQASMLQELGLTAEKLDLRDYFGKKPRDILNKLREFGLVWVCGGNSFILRRAFAQSGFDEAITDLLAADEIVYGGFSAGACVMTPTLMGIDLCDDPEVVPKGYQPEIIWDGLGLVDYSIVPHYKSDHPESALLDETALFLEDRGIPFKTLRDGEVIIINDQPEELLR